MACDDSTEHEDSSGIDRILESPDAQNILGTAIGDELNYVVTQMEPHIVSKMPDEITARIPLDIKDSTYYEIDYAFNNDKMYSLDLDIYPKNEADCKLLFEDFKQYYNKSYGKGQETDGYMVWYTKSRLGVDVEISMMDESQSHKKPYLAITFFQEENISR